MADMADAAALILEARRRAGLTQSVVAQRAGTSQSAIARYESRMCSPSVATLERVLHACGASLHLTTLPAPASDLNTTLANRVRSRRTEIHRILTRHGFHSPRLFGSVARGAADGSSDIDLVVTSVADLDLMELIRAKNALGALLDTEVDLVTLDLLKSEIRSIVEREAVPV